MKHIIFILICLVSFIIIPAQSQALKIQDNKKEKILEENKRVIVMTTAGDKIKGRLSIESDSTIVIKNTQIALKDIKEIRTNSLGVSLATSTAFTYMASASGITALIFFAFGPAGAAYFFSAVSVLLLYAAIKPPKFSRKFKLDNGLKLEIIPYIIQEESTNKKADN